MEKIDVRSDEIPQHRRVKMDIFLQEAEQRQEPIPQELNCRPYREYIDFSYSRNNKEPEEHNSSPFVKAGI